MKNKVTAFLAAGVLIHALLFGAGYIFLGLPATLLLSFLWSCAWIIYCGRKEAPLLSGVDDADNPDKALLAGSGEAPVLPMAVAGGPWCWLLSPTCLFPGSYRKAMQLGLGWSFAARLLRAFCRSFLRIMGFIYDYCAEIFNAAEKGENAGGGEGDKS